MKVSENLFNICTITAMRPSLAQQTFHLALSGRTTHRTNQFVSRIQQTLKKSAHPSNQKTPETDQKPPS